MIYRRRKAMRFEKLLWITKGAASRVGFLSNKYTPSRGRGLNACISSRITTVIHVASHHQINYNWFNEPFAVSPYNWFILRHAWLNLWDKHMTTGRINQVTTFHFHAIAPQRAQCVIHPILAISHCWLLSWLGVCPLIDEQFWLWHQEAFSWFSLLSNSNQFVRPPLSPGLTSFRSMSFCHLYKVQQNAMAFRGNYQWPALHENVHWSWWIPNWLSASGLAIGKKSTMLHQCKQFILLDRSIMSR
jgi:hypothetical protein